MGLAASQARFLGITARKSNIEYEGQQVNQQRTALAEEVNALYNKLLALDVPIAPDTTEYYKTNYSFNVTNTSDDYGDYIIKKYYPNADQETYSVITQRTYEKESAVGTVLKNGTNPIEKVDDNFVIYGITDEGITLKKCTPAESSKMISYINTEYPDKKVTSDYLYAYQDASKKTYYLDPKDVEAFGTETEPTKYSTYTTCQKEIVEERIFEEATIEFDNNNRMTSITLDKDNQTTFDVEPERTYDTEGYDAALRDYTMSKDEYDKMIADLNSRTEVLQQEDKILELRLNQIDTEQKELDTELAAVKEVLKKNIESTFKTFA